MAAKNSLSAPRTAPAEVRRQQLIDATITCIEKHGISGTTLTAVTKEAGLSLGLVNFHFKSKDALLAATLRHLAEEHRSLWMRKSLQSGLGPVAKLRAILDAQFHPQVCNRRKLAVWFAFFGEARYRKTYLSISGSVDMERQDICTQLCHALITEGRYENVSPEEVSHTLEGMFDGLWLNILMYPDRFKPQSTHKQVLAYLSRCFPQHF